MLAKAVHQSQMGWLVDRIREQARSHMGSIADPFQPFVFYIQPLD